jgi:hypothetical protein
MKETLKNQFNKVNPALAREYFDNKFTDSQLLTLDHDRAAIIPSFFLEL